MSFSISQQPATLAGKPQTVYVLSGPMARAEVWPGAGFNCLRWQIGQPPSNDLLYVAPDWESNPVPTRSGTPILFPFPNRIRDGVFFANGQQFILPKNDSMKANAIHGFTPRNPWRVLDFGADATSAFVTGIFRLSVDAPESLPLWPTDFILLITIRLSDQRLRFDCRVENPTRQPLPFGLGLHQYFRLPQDQPRDNPIDDYVVQCSARRVWELKDSLPTGETRLLTPEEDLRDGQVLGSRKYDDVLTDLPTASIRNSQGLYLRGWIALSGKPTSLELWTSSEFRELVLFTPAHRKAICLEPYTCTTDAANLQARGVDAGWQVLPPGGVWAGIVEFRFDPTGVAKHRGVIPAED